MGEEVVVAARHHQREVVVDTLVKVELHRQAQGGGKVDAGLSDFVGHGIDLLAWRWRGVRLII